MNDMYMKVQKIENGTVIDHIPAGKALDVFRILKLQTDMSISILINTPSKADGRKDILKVENVELEDEQVNRLATIAPNATVNIIRKAGVFKKSKVKAPEIVKGAIRCENPNCISNQKEPVPPELRLQSGKPPVYVCAYCDRVVQNISKNLIV